jgi:hypothetical protein
VSRGFLQRLAYRRLWACPCGRTRRIEPRPLYSLVARCPKCGGVDLRRRSERDRIDRLLKNPFRIAQMLVGASLYHCQLCRIQFHDVRPRKRATESPTELPMQPAQSRARRA